MVANSTCSNRLPEYCRDTAEPWSVFCAAGMSTTAEAAIRERGTGVRGVRRPAAPCCGGGFRRLDDAGGGAGARRREKQVAGADGGRGGFARDVDRQPQVHEPHGRHFQDEAAAPGPGHEDPVGQPQLGDKGRDLCRIDALEHFADFVLDKEPVAVKGPGHIGQGGRISF